jgi:hypothetical protein
MVNGSVIASYLALMDFQRETVLSMLDGLSDEQLWQRPAPKEWSIGEILDHNYLLMASFLPAVKRLWGWFGWYGRLRRSRTYTTKIEDVYRDPKFPQWVGFLWTPRFNTRKPVPLEQIKAELRELHDRIRQFYEGKDEEVLGNLYLFDPVFGWINLIVTLRIGIYHDQLHFDDVINQFNEIKRTDTS